jgi:putative flippase GtrA
VSRPSLFKRQFFRFLVVGALNTAFSYTVYATLLYLSVPYVLANLGALMLGVLFSFRTQGQLVFGNTDGRLIGRFALVWGVVFLINITIIGVLSKLGLNYYAAGAVAMVPVTLLSYLFQRLLVFAEAK